MRVDDTEGGDMTSGRRAGLRGSAPLLLPTAAIGLTFGLLAAQVFGAIPALVMSALVWSAPLSSRP